MVNKQLSLRMPGLIKTSAYSYHKSTPFPLRGQLVCCTGYTGGWMGMPTAPGVESTGGNATRYSICLHCCSAGLGLCTGHSWLLQPAGLTTFWQQFPAQCRACIKVEERQRQASAWGHSTSHSHAGPCLLWSLEPMALFSGLVRGNTSVVFTVGDRWAFSVPGTSPYPAAGVVFAVSLQAPGRPSYVVGWNSVGVCRQFCNCWAPETAWLS